MVILDTNVLIDHLRQNPATGESLLERYVSTHQGEQLAISLITVQELYQGKSSQLPQKEMDLLALISQFTQLPVTFEIARLAGTVTRDADQVLTFADAAIAATAIFHHAELLTLNEKDFEKIPGVVVDSE